MVQELNMPKLANGAGIEGSSLAGAQPYWGYSLAGDIALLVTQPGSLLGSFICSMTILLAQMWLNTDTGDVVNVELMHWLRWLRHPKGNRCFTLGLQPRCTRTKTSTICIWDACLMWWSLFLRPCYEGLVFVWVIMIIWSCIAPL